MPLTPEQLNGDFKNVRTLMASGKLTIEQANAIYNSDSEIGPKKLAALTTDTVREHLLYSDISFSKLESVYDSIGGAEKLQVLARREAFRTIVSKDFDPASDICHRVDNTKFDTLVGSINSLYEHNPAKFLENANFVFDEALNHINRDTALAKIVSRTNVVIGNVRTAGTQPRMHELARGDGNGGAVVNRSARAATL